MEIDLSDDHLNRRSQKPGTNEFALTMLSEAPLFYRLLSEIEFIVQRFKQSWPKFKKEPIKSMRAAASEFAGAVRRVCATSQMGFALVISVLILTFAIVAILALERRTGTRRFEDGTEPLEVVTTFNFPSNSDAEKDRGIGAGERGRVGFQHGNGEGSGPTPVRAHGGGSGGDGLELPSSRGRIPVPSIIPAPIPTAVVPLPPALPVAGIDLDPALWRKLDYSSYGDPRSKETTPSNGPGDGGGVGTHSGTGIGEGDGPGFGPGRDGNMGGGRKGVGCCGEGGSRGNNPNEDDTDRVYKSPEVSSRPRVISKPEPTYTEQARRNQVTGTVVLRVVFSSDGQVTNIQAMQRLSDGLTEKAIAAAKQIRFLPATRHGQPVSMYMQLEYNFNLY